MVVLLLLSCILCCRTVGQVVTLKQNIYWALLGWEDLPGCPSFAGMNICLGCDWYYTGRPRKKLVSELLNSIKGALLCWMFKFSNALLCWMIGRWWLWRFSMTNFVLPKNCQKMPKCENVKFWIPSQWHSDCVQNFWGRPKSKIGRPVPFWKFQILGCWWWRELLSCVG